MTLNGGLQWRRRWWYFCYWSWTNPSHSYTIENPLMSIVIHTHRERETQTYSIVCKIWNNLHAITNIFCMNEQRTNHIDDLDIANLRKASIQYSIEFFFIHEKEELLHSADGLRKLINGMMSTRHKVYPSICTTRYRTQHASLLLFNTNL